MRYTAIYIEATQNWAVADALSCDFALKFFASKKSARLFVKKEEKRWNLLKNFNQVSNPAS